MKKQYQLSEFQFYDGEEFITFNLIFIISALNKSS